MSCNLYMYAERCSIVTYFLFKKFAALIARLKLERLHCAISLTYIYKNTCCTILLYFTVLLYFGKGKIGFGT